MIISTIIWVLITVIMALIAVVETAIWIVLIVAAVIILVVFAIVALIIVILVLGTFDIIIWPIRKAVRMYEKRTGKINKDESKYNGSEDEKRQA